MGLYPSFGAGKKLTAEESENKNQVKIITIVIYYVDGIIVYLFFSIHIRMLTVKYRRM